MLNIGKLSFQLYTELYGNKRGVRGKLCSYREFSPRVSRAKLFEFHIFYNVLDKISPIFFPVFFLHYFFFFVSFSFSFSWERVHSYLRPERITIAARGSLTEDERANWDDVIQRWDFRSRFVFYLFFLTFSIFSHFPFCRRVRRFSYFPRFLWRSGLAYSDSEFRYHLIFTG